MIEVGTRVRIQASVMIYHHPEHRNQAFDAKGLEGEVSAIVDQWQGRPVSANYQIQVKFPNKLRAHFQEDELEVV